MSVEELAKELRDESARLSGRSLDRGCADSGISSNIADKAADKLEELAAEAHEWRDRVRYLIKCIDENRAYEDRLKTVLLQRRRQR